MKIISDKLYNTIPLFDRLDVMPIKKLIKYAWKHCGIRLDFTSGYNKYDLIDEILMAVSKDRDFTIQSYKGKGA